MNESILVIAPHADDETLGCGGTILKHKYKNDQIHYLLVTQTEKGQIISGIKPNQRSEQVKKMIKFYDFDSFYKLGFIATKLDSTPLNNIIEKINDVIKIVKPNIIYLPFPGDIHSDHSIVFKAAIACSKWFRSKSLHTILAYETLSETNFSINPTAQSFKPNLYIDISDFIEGKIKACKIFNTEIQNHPFPRSIDSINALSIIRGSESGFKSAEAFMLLKKIEN